MQDWIKSRIERLLDNILFNIILALCLTGGAVVWSKISNLPGPMILVIGLAVFAWILLIREAIKGKLLKKDKNKTLRSIPKIIFKMHERLTSLVERMPPLTKTELEALQEDYLELLGFDESHYPESKQITPMSDVKADRKVLGIIIDKLLSTFTEMETDDIKSLFIQIGGLMNIKGTGISQVGDHDRKYARLKRQLNELRFEIPIELNTAITNYLQFSFGYLSMYRLSRDMLYREITNALPPKWSAELRIWKEQRMDTAMNELLAEVVSVIQKLIREAADSSLISHKEGSQ